MCKRFFHALLILLQPIAVRGQQPSVDSLLHQPETVQNDTARMIRFGALTEAYGEINPDSSYYYAEQQLTLARRLKLKLNEVHALNKMRYARLNTGNYSRTLQLLL